MNEITRGFTYLYTRLSGDSTLMALVTGIFQGIAPENQPTPYVVMTYQGGRDVVGSGGARIMVEAPYQVYVIGPAAIASTTLQSAADRIDFLLEMASGNTSDGRVMAIRRQQAIAVDELVNGTSELWTRLGGIYRLWIRPLS